MQNKMAAITITYPNGQQVDYYILCRFWINEREYIALSPQDDGIGTIELYRFEITGEDIRISTITSDYELDNIRSEYYKIMEHERFETEQSAINNVYTTLTDECGNESVCQIIKTFKYNSHQILAAIPFEDTANTVPKIQLFFYQTDDDSTDPINIIINEIPSYMFNNVQDYFIRLLKNESD